MYVKRRNKNMFAVRSYQSPTAVLVGARCSMSIATLCACRTTVVVSYLHCSSGIPGIVRYLAQLPGVLRVVLQ